MSKETKKIELTQVEANAAAAAISGAIGEVSRYISNMKKTLGKQAQIASHEEHLKHLKEVLKKLEE